MAVIVRFTRLFVHAASLISRRQTAHLTYEFAIGWLHRYHPEMSFRRDKSDAHRRQREWGAWIDAHRAELVAMGVPPEIYLDESRWDDFLQNGHLHWHEGTGWGFDELSRDQIRALGRFLDRHFAGDPRCQSLLGYINVRTS